MAKDTLPTTDLRLFDEGGAGAQAETMANPGGSRPGKTGESGRRGRTAEGGDPHRMPEKVIYGKQAGGGAPSQSAAQPQTAPPEGEPGAAGGPDAGDQAHTPTPEARRAEFERLISQEYKDLFDERTQKIINRRFKEVKGLEGQVKAAQPILDLLAQRYGIEGGDLGRLAQAIEADDAYWAQAARDHGMTEAQFREYRKLQRENEAFRSQARQTQGELAVRQQLEDWRRQAAEVQRAYPGFDLAAECRDGQFLGMLKAGVPMRHAYEVRHLEDIKTGVAAQVSRRTERQVTETIRAKGARPPENGASGTSGILVKADPGKLSRADRAEIARRVARGESIEF